MERVRGGHERDRHRGGGRPRRPGLRGRALHRVRAALDVRGRADRTTPTPAGCSGSSTSPATSATVHPHSLAVVDRDRPGGRGCSCASGCTSATIGCASATRDRLTPSGRRALVTADRPLDRRPRAAAGAPTDLPRCIPAGGGRLLLPSGRPGRRRAARRHEDVYVVRRRRSRAHARPAPAARARAARRQRRGRCWTASRSRCAAATLELLALLSMRHPAALSADDALRRPATATAASPASVRVEVSRLRKLLGRRHRHRPATGSRAASSSDVARVRGPAGRADDVREARRAAYPGPLLPGSRGARVIERQRESPATAGCARRC